MSYSSEVLADSPWGFWRLAEASVSTSFADSGSNGIAFPFGAAVTVGLTPLPSDGGHSASGGGSDSIAALASTPTSLAGANVTIEAWVNIPAANVSGLFAKIGGGTNGWGVGVGSGVLTTAGHELILLAENVAYYATGFTLSAGTHHVVCVRGASGATTAYVDGVSVWSGTISPTTASGNTSVGGEPGKLYLSSTVKVDNVAMFAAALTSTQVAAHYASGAGSNTAVAADSPTVWLRLDETAPSLADASGNGRPLTPTGTAPTLGIAGPVGGGKAAAFSAAAGSANTTAFPVGQPTTVTYEAWLYLTAIPAAETVVMTFGGSGSSGMTSGMSVTSAGKVKLTLYTGSSVDITAPSALSLNAWHHVVCSVNGAGAKIRVDKTTVASSATASVMSATSGLFYLRNGGPNAPAGAGAMTIAEPAAYYNAQLSDARTDAHYDAALAVTPTGTLAATLPSLTASASGVSTPPPSGALAATLPSLTGDVEGTYQLPGTAGILTATLPSLAGDLEGSYALAGQVAATLPALTGNLSGAVEVDAALAATLPPLTGSLAGVLGDDFLIATLPSLQAAMTGVSLAIVGTDTTVGSYGYSYAGSGVLDYDPPVTPEPAHGGRAHVRRIHRSMPTPTLVDGSPT